MSSAEYLNDEVQRELRAKGLLRENEVAKKLGDIVVAISVIDNSQRIIGNTASVIKENRRVLKG